MGWSTNNAAYLLRPELFESTFYLARLGGTSVAHHVAQITVDYFRLTLKTKCGLASQRGARSQVLHLLTPDFYLIRYLRCLVAHERNAKLRFERDLSLSLPACFASYRVESTGNQFCQSLCCSTLLFCYAVAIFNYKCDFFYRGTYISFALEATGSFRPRKDGNVELER